MIVDTLGGLRADHAAAVAEHLQLELGHGLFGGRIGTAVLVGEARASSGSVPASVVSAVSVSAPAVSVTVP